MLKNMYNFLTLSEDLFTGGMPTVDQIKDAARQGVQLVVNLAPHDVIDALPNEEKLVTSLGMHYINIPVLWNTPTRDGLNRFMDVMDENRGKKILVHCQANFRATAFMALYRILRLGWNSEDAMKGMDMIWDVEDYPIWKMFILENLKRSQARL
jgi:protein tyrosine phosphatase (PTP) superfamily phosphohydrolase (DUF442 family)